MPAMPLRNAIDTVESWDNLTGGGRFIPANGLTKREMFAKDADVSSCQLKDIQATEEFLGRKINTDSIEDLFKANFEVMAKLKVMAADALLAELEK